MPVDSGFVATPDKYSTDARMRATLAAVAPGTELREGLERILRGRTGALLVLGHDKVVESICTGGFAIDVEFTATGPARAEQDGRRDHLRPRRHPDRSAPPST